MAANVLASDVFTVVCKFLDIDEIAMYAVLKALQYLPSCRYDNVLKRRLFFSVSIAG